MKKPNFYGSRRAFEAGAPHDGFWLEPLADGLLLTGRINGRLYHYEQFSNDGGVRYNDGVVTIRVGPDGAPTLEASATPPNAAYVLDLGRYHALAALLRGITDPTRVHAVNTPLLRQGSP